MELLVVIAIILILAAIAFPVYSSIQAKSNKAVAVNNMRQLAAALTAYAGENNQELPRESAKGPDTWEAAADPANGDVWYNALPKRLGQKTVGEYARSPREFYSRQNIIFLPGATYPEAEKKLITPQFAISINTKLLRSDDSGEKKRTRLSEIALPQRTVMFFEHGIKGEQKAVPTQPAYDGTPKGSARSFVARYGGVGVVTFCDGSANPNVEAKDILTETGKIIWTQGIIPDIIWCRTPDEDPNN